MSETIYIPQLSKYSYAFPDPRNASAEGLLAWGGDLNKDRVLLAYMNGIFPWYNADDPILWWSPDPRLVLFPKDLKISKSLKKSMKKYEVRYDTNFNKVINLCQKVRLETGEGTWINGDIIKVFNTLHVEGFAHSVETYFEDELVGGLYGLSIGNMFCGESMFSTKSDASKTALVALCSKISEIGGDFIDCQIPTNHLKYMGAKEIKRDYFLDMVEKSLETKSASFRWDS